MPTCAVIMRIKTAQDHISTEIRMQNLERMVNDTEKYRSEDEKQRNNISVLT